MQKAIDNCRMALKKLDSFIDVANKDSSEVVRAGVIQAFEFNFEAFWKLFQKLAGQEGITANSPKTAFSAAFQMGLIKNEAIWLSILNDRNLTTHTYHEDLANEIFKRIKESYVDQFKAAMNEVQKKA